MFIKSYSQWQTFPVVSAVSGKGQGSTIKWSTGKVLRSALLANIRLGWSVCPGTNTPAYYEHS